jgi:hypothetical protein
MPAPVFLLGHAAPPLLATAAAVVAAAALAAALVFVALLAARITTNLRRYSRVKLPSPPIVSTVLGHAGLMLTDTAPIKMAQLVAELGPIFKLRVLTGTLVVVSDPPTIVKLNRWVGGCRYLSSCRVRVREHPAPSRPLNNCLHAAANRLPGVIKPELYRGFDLPSARSASMFSDSGSPYWKVRVALCVCVVCRSTLHQQPRTPSTQPTSTHPTANALQAVRTGVAPCFSMTSLKRVRLRLWPRVEGFWL